MFGLVQKTKGTLFVEAWNVVKVKISCKATQCALPLPSKRWSCFDLQANSGISFGSEL